MQMDHHQINGIRIRLRCYIASSYILLEGLMWELVPSISDALQQTGAKTERLQELLGLKPYCRLIATQPLILQTLGEHRDQFCPFCAGSLFLTLNRKGLGSQETEMTFPAYGGENTLVANIMVGFPLAR
jgi:hypothetical protein